MASDIEGKMDLTKTEQIFDSLIKRSGINDTTKSLDDAEIRKVKTVLGGGNLHIRTAQIRVTLLRLAGFRDGIRQTKLAVQKKVRNARKYGGQ